ncbi:transposase [Streptomyces sp. NPDC056656]|uniref:transposase n=1 Tax=Streptomyces sp. NPDC056656 TaxID=3345895 RepID=UPI0036A2827A
MPARRRTPAARRPDVPIWDNLNTNVSRITRQLIDARLWLTVYQLPAYAPEFNPVEGVWSHLKRSLATPRQMSPAQVGSPVLLAIRERSRRSSGSCCSSLPDSRCCG